MKCSMALGKARRTWAAELRQSYKPSSIYGPLRPPFLAHMEPFSPPHTALCQPMLARFSAWLTRQGVPSSGSEMYSAEHVARGSLRATNRQTAGTSRTWLSTIAPVLSGEWPHMAASAPGLGR